MAATSSKPFSISFGSSKTKPPPPPSSSTSKKRPHSALADPDSDHEEKAEPQIVTGFDQSAGGAIGISAPQTKATLVIPAQRNRDWREESRRKRGKNLLPAEVQAARGGSNGLLPNGGPERNEVSKAAGLEFVSQDEKKGDGQMLNGPTTTATASIDMSQVTTQATAAVDDDEEAMQALLGYEKKSSLVLRAQDATSHGENGTTNGLLEAEEYMNEDDRFKADVATRPDSANLDAYVAVPVEEFGAALLRGMGWKEGGAIGKGKGQGQVISKARVVERRPALLGIGAKEVPGGIGEELGAWGKVAKGGKKKKMDMAYNPVMLKNTLTGEMLTEEELENQKILEAKRGREEKEDWRERRDRNLAADRERRKKRRRGRERLAIEDDDGDDNDGTNDDYESPRRERSRSNERRRRGDSRRENRSRSRERRQYESSRRERSRSSDKNRHRSSRRERSSRSRERKHGRRDYDGIDRTDRDYRRR